MQESTLELIHCPVCKGQLGIHVFGGGGGGSRISDGALTCPECRNYYPVVQGVPVLLVYPTALTRRFIETWERDLRRLGSDYHLPQGRPAPGERWVQKSFGGEWKDYQYDGVLFWYTYEERLAILRSEIGPLKHNREYRRLADIGCGIGVTTELAAREFDVEGVGLDLSDAVFQAAKRFESNDRLHFVQGSVFPCPLREATFDLVYSSGVLHHTYSTEAAFRSIAPLCAPGGRLYLWLYGKEATRNTFSRRAMHALERLLVPVTHRLPGWASSLILMPVALALLTYRRLRPRRGTGQAPVNLRRALHAARDQFTPAFSHRHESEEVCGWFRAAQFRDIHLLDVVEFPESVRRNLLGNVAVRGDRSAERTR